MLGKGVTWLWRVDGVVFGVVCHHFVIFTLYSMGVGCLGLVFTCVL